MKKNNYKKGFSLMEVLVVLGIMALVIGIVFGGFANFQNSKSVSADAEAVVEILRQAKNETLSSKNSNAYGVYFGTNTMTIFVGPTYSAGAGTNRVIPLPSYKTSISKSLAGGVSYVLFQKLTGETSQNGTLTLTSSSTSQTKTVTIYKTGIVEMN